MDFRHGCVAAALSFSVGYAAATQWFTVSGPEIDASVAALVEIDLETVRTRSPTADAVIRVTHQEAKLHAAGFGYRSFIATEQFDCQRRLLTLTSAVYFSDPEGRGLRVGTDSAAREGGMPAWLLDDLPQGARRALLRASCAHMQTY